MKKRFKQPRFKNICIKQIQPQGWLRRQLEIQAEGLCGNLDLFWPDIKDSKWIGGSREGWERVPYWLDGFIPLAYLLDDGNMKKRAGFYIDTIIKGQQEDGWLCPCTYEERSYYDVWSLFLILKVLILYDSAADDSRIETVVYKALKNLDRHIDIHTLSGWAQMRWYECLFSIMWLYERRPEEWLIDLAVKLKSQGFDYKTLFDNFPYEKAVKKDMWSLMSHGVNIAMALKSKALEYLISGDRETLEYTDYMLKQLEYYHGMVTGMFSSDECLSGKSPVQGTELCAVTEMMYSLETLTAISGEGKYGDLLERITFNALPAAISPDMWSHQYDQQVNQINCIETETPIFNTNRGDSNLFGLEPHFGCCTANFGQGWPKFALSTIMQGEEGIYVVSYAPNKVRVLIDDTPVTIEVQGEYPFRDKVIITIESETETEFALMLRIPEYVWNARIQADELYLANAGKIFTLKKVWKRHARIEIDFNTCPVFESRPENLVALKRGPLVFSLKIDEEWVRVHENEKGKEIPHCDYEVHGKSEWRYGIVDLDTETIWHEIGRYPFSPEGAPVEMRVKCGRIDWKEENTYAARVPSSRKPKGDTCVKTFIPYGCTNIRITELPYIGEVMDD
ncbi:MAG: glycoside hydrolase family 127 protein [Eubacteriales bacterium]|nr:glycoside hydrolase family 127 protein [Eubacteriales bacterium]